MQLYKIRNTKTGKFSAGGTTFSKEGKWFTEKTLRLHLSQFTSHTPWPEMLLFYKDGVYPNHGDYEIVIYQVDEACSINLMEHCKLLLNERNLKEQIRREGN